MEVYKGVKFEPSQVNMNATYDREGVDGKVSPEVQSIPKTVQISPGQSLGYPAGKLCGLQRS